MTWSPALSGPSCHLSQSMMLVSKAISKAQFASSYFWWKFIPCKPRQIFSAGLERHTVSRWPKELSMIFSKCIKYRQFLHIFLLYLFFGYLPVFCTICLKEADGGYGQLAQFAAHHSSPSPVRTPCPDPDPSVLCTWAVGVAVQLSRASGRAEFLVRLWRHF